MRHINYNMLNIFPLILLIACSQAVPLITREFVEELRGQVTWEVESYENNIFKQWTEEEFKYSFCSDFNAPSEELVTDADEEVDEGDLPTDFDGRKKWPKCIHPIRTQGRCGSCWAFATAEAISDRFCIAGKDVILSPENLVACDTANHGCGGGYAPYAMTYTERHGLLTEECFPYVSDKQKTPACPKNKCPGKGTFRKYHCKPGSTTIVKTRPQMKQEIMTYGPVATRFNHYADFNSYKGGIYYHKTGKYICGHYMKPVGWGVEKGVNFWILANTYGPAWGEKGYVRVKMGDSAVDVFMTFCRPQV